MPVTLTANKSAPAEGFDGDLTIGQGGTIPDLPHRLEDIFTEVFPQWQDLATRWRAVPGAELSHAPSCAPNASDFGMMLVWDRLVGQLAAGEAHILVRCDDPWLFRQLAERDGVTPRGSSQNLLLATARMQLRGFAARLAYALRVMVWSLCLKGQRYQPKTGAPALLVYGHLGSDAQGRDGYFGDALQRFPALVRMLHTDAPLVLSKKLAKDGRTQSLHAWGCPLYALALPFARWTPAEEAKNTWLVRRLGVLESGSAQGASIMWQQHCQRRWLRRVKPSVVAWPWENHGWERSLVVEAKSHGVRTLGCQHALVGRQEFNYAWSEQDADYILCTGQVNRDQLVRFGHDAARLSVAGAVRYAAPAPFDFDKDGPVVFALPFSRSVAMEMVAAAGTLKGKVVIKDHPMAPISLDLGGLGTDKSWSDLGGLAAVVYAAGAVGLEMALNGLPVLRFQPKSTLALVPEPEGLDFPAASAEDLEAALADIKPVEGLDRGKIFAPPDWDKWQEALGLKGQKG